MATREQERAEIIGKYGCLALSYLKLAGILTDKADRTDSLFKNYDSLSNKGYIDGNNCYVNDPVGLVKDVYGADVTVYKTEQSPKTVSVAYNGIHFVIVDENDKILYNSLGDSHNEIWYKRPIKSWRVMRRK